MTVMKMRTIHFFAAALVVGCATSCVEENLEKDLDINNDPKAIRFGVTSQNVQTKTVYGTPDDSEVDWPLYWVSGDQIHIFCPDAEDLKFAGYTVTPNPDTENNETSTTTHKGTISQMVEGEYLQWSGDSNPHDFYAAYPYGKAIAAEQTTATKDDGTEYETAYITFSINNNQVCEIPSTTTSGNYVAAPQMSNAYMVACTQDVLPSDDAVELDFKPIMTTLVVKVTAPTMQEGDNSGYNATITGLSVISEVNSSDADKGQFVWDAAGEKLVHNKVSGGTKATHTTFVGIKHGNNQFVDLKSGETLTMTVFLPPIVINDENPVQIKLHVAGSDFSAHLGIDAPDSHPTNEVYANVTIAPSKIRRVNLPMLPSPLPSNSNWITPLDDDIYVSQLSIPGTHDAATSGCSLSQGRCQSLTIPQQLAMGIRVFDLRPSLDSDSSLLNGRTFTGLGDIYHGVNSTNVTMGEAMNYFDTFLTENPGEFVIILMRWEQDRYLIYAGSDSDYVPYMTTFLKNNEVYQKRKRAFKPDLTIGDMREGILILSRNNLSPNTEYETAYTGWNHNNNDGTVNTIAGTGGSTDIYIQDMFSPGENGDSTNDEFLAKKYELVKAMMDRTATFHTDQTKINTWAINHCSGYAGSSLDPSAYAKNGNSTNLKAYEYLTGTVKPVGSTGIVLLDFVGARDATVRNLITDVITVYGDLMPQAIIDNNYKYRMKRKGE